MPWKNPSKSERRRALTGTSPVLKSMYKETYSIGIRKLFEMFYKADSSAFYKQINNSDPSDWLLNHKEEGQSYEAFWKARLTRIDYNTYSSMAASMKSSTMSICILPLGPFPSAAECETFRDGHRTNPLLSWLESYCKAFFHTAKVTLLPAVSLEEVACDYRVNEFTGRFQLNATDILGYLKRRKTKNQDCLVAVTMIDLFPKPSWNFVFGLASTSKGCVGGVGVSSFCRYEDSFYERWSLTEDVVKRHQDGTLDYSVFTDHVTPQLLTPTENRRLLLRACKVMTHEICHMFGVKHCIWTQCLMNGTNHLQESDRRPPHLCPPCLRKLQSVINFDILERYKTLYNWTVGKPWKVQSRDSLNDISDTDSSRSGSSRTGSTAKRKAKPQSASKRRSSKCSSQDSKKKTSGLRKTPSPGALVPPLESFSEYRTWLRDAIEFILSHGKSGFLPSPPEEF